MSDSTTHCMKTVFWEAKFLIHCMWAALSKYQICLIYKQKTVIDREPKNSNISEKRESRYSFYLQKFVNFFHKSTVHCKKTTKKCENYNILVTHRVKLMQKCQQILTPEALKEYVVLFMKLRETKISSVLKMGSVWKLSKLNICMHSW